MVPNTSGFMCSNNSCGASSPCSIVNTNCQNPCYAQQQAQPQQPQSQMPFVNNNTFGATMCQPYVQPSPIPSPFPNNIGSVNNYNQPFTNHIDSQQQPQQPPQQQQSQSNRHNPIPLYQNEVLQEYGYLPFASHPQAHFPLKNEIDIPLPEYAPCQGPRPWNYAYCYGFYGEPACPMINLVDMEDFMNNEKRKEKSRDAARCRRSRETEIFTELSESLPVPQREIEQLDKASIIRLTIATLKVRNMFDMFALQNEGDCDGDSNESKIVESSVDPEFLFEDADENMAMQALDGFLLVLSNDGDIIYVSENIHDYVGIQQIDVIGQSVWDYIHQCDCTELREALDTRHLEPNHASNEGENPTNHDQYLHRNILIRMKCTLTNRGKNVNIKSASYKVINIVGHMMNDKTNNTYKFVGIGRPIPHPSNIDVPLDSKTFLTKHSLDMKFSYIDDKMLSILGYTPTDLMEKSLYDYHYTCDSESLMVSFKNVINKGQAETSRYRFLARNGGYCWVVTQATLVYGQQKPQSVVCVNYVISEIESENEIYSFNQLEAFNSLSESKNQRLETDQLNINDNIDIDQKSNPVEIQEIFDHESIPKLIEIIENAPASTTAAAPAVPLVPAASPAPVVNAIQRIVPLKQLLNERKTNPKTVTASVFKAISADVKLLKTIPPASARPHLTSMPGVAGHNLHHRCERGVTDKLPNVDSKLNCCQKVVTASLIQSRKNYIQKSSPSQQIMNKAFFMFADNTPQLCLLKEDPDDLGNLVTADNTVGCNMNGSLTDSNIPSLDDSVPMFGEMFDELMLPDGYGALLPDDISSLDSQSNKIDPFMSYRDESSETVGTPHILSPCLSKSPDGSSSLPSLCSPGSLSQEDEIAFMSTNLNDDDIDLSMRAPYIPMNESDDLPLLTEDLMWSAFSDEVSLHKTIKDTSIAIGNATITQPHCIDILSTTQQRKSGVHSLLAYAAEQDNANYKELHNKFMNSGITNDNIRNKMANNDMANNTITNIASNKFDNNNISVGDVSANGSNDNNDIVGLSAAGKVSIGRLTNAGSNLNAFNQSHNTQPTIDDDAAEIMKAHDRQHKTNGVDGIIGTDSMASINVEEFDDDTFSKSCSNQLPLWTMTDLLQLNANDLSTFTQQPTSKIMINPTVHFVTKHKATNQSAIANKPIVNEIRIVQMQKPIPKMATNHSSKKHKIQTVLDTANINPKRIKAANGPMSNAKQSSKVDQQRQQLETVAPQLLQQLMAPMPYRLRLDETGENNNSDSKWSGVSTIDRGSSNADSKMPLQPSNSVLKNLLVSGCDISAGYICTVPMPIHQKKVARA